MMLVSLENKDIEESYSFPSFFLGCLCIWGYFIGFEYTKILLVDCNNDAQFI